jgi:lysophospholipase L1-like esterase
LLWRIQNGELPVRLNPSVFWLLIGTNDIGNTWCSPELVVIGIIRIVEEIRSKKPAATVVVNALLPRSFHKNGYVAKGDGFKVSVWEDLKVINDELKLYANYRDRVEFFETSVFFKDSKALTSKLQIDHELMPDYLHPSAMGYLQWGEEIVARLRELRNDRG